MVTKITESMDLSQALQTLKWLDEERRKDKATIAKLEERLKDQEHRIARRAQEIGELQASVRRLQDRVSKVDEFEQMMSNLKKQMAFQLEQRDEKWGKERAEAQRLRRLEHEAMKEHLSRLETQLRPIARHEQQLDANQAEQERLSEKMQRLGSSVADLNKRIEDATNAVSYLEERRRSDHRRLTEAEKDLADTQQDAENLAQKFPVLEEGLQKQAARIDTAIQAAKQLEKPIEELRVSDFQREQKVKMYLDQAEQVEEELERIREQTHGFIERRQQVKRALNALETFKTRLERRQDEMGERQRLAEERLEREWEEWQTNRAKELKKREIVVEQRWQDQGETDREQQRRLEILEATAEMYRDQLNALWQAQRTDASALLTAAQDVYEQLVGPVDEQLATLRGE